MLSGKTKNKIYAVVSVMTLVSIIASFLAIVSFLVYVNNIIFSVDEKMIKEKTIVLNIEGYDQIKDKVEMNYRAIGR